MVSVSLGLFIDTNQAMLSKPFNFNSKEYSMVYFVPNLRNRLLTRQICLLLSACGATSKKVTSYEYIESN